jgi:hypothetical protein
MLTRVIEQGGSTALMLVASTGHVNVVQYLVEVGANLESADYVSSHVVWEYVDV